MIISGLKEQLQQQFEYTQLKPDCHIWWISKMQSGREDTLEEQYAITFCFKLGENATETYGMLLTAFGDLAWIEHQFLSGIRDSRKAGSLWGISKEVRTPELIGQKKNFIDKDRCVSIDTISAEFDDSVGTVHTIICEELKMRKICAKFVPKVFREDQKERRCHDSREMVGLINLDPSVLDKKSSLEESTSSRWVDGSQPVRIALQTYEDDERFVLIALQANGSNYLSSRKRHEILTMHRNFFKWTFLL